MTASEFVCGFCGSDEDVRIAAAFLVGEGETWPWEEFHPLDPSPSNYVEVPMCWECAQNLAHMLDKLLEKPYRFIGVNYL